MKRAIVEVTKERYQEDMIEMLEVKLSDHEETIESQELEIKNLKARLTLQKSDPELANMIDSLRESVAQFCHGMKSSYFVGIDEIWILEREDQEDAVLCSLRGMESFTTYPDKIEIDLEESMLTLRREGYVFEPYRG